MNVPENLLYSREHEWVRIEGNKAWVGITDFAQDSLGDVIYVELPEVGAEVDTMGEAGVIESVKAVSTMYSPMGGTILEVNEGLNEAPGNLNSDPYGNYIFVLEIKDMSDKDSLLDAGGYKDFCK